VLEDIQDPGNLGTMFRTGEGAGISGIIMTKNTVDLFSPKTVRATMGSIYRMPFFITEDLPQTLAELRMAGVHTFAAHLAAKQYYDQMDFTGACAFLVGNEGNGLKKETADLADTYLKIPMEGRLESLNAAVAASILMYEAHRQCRQKRKELQL
jgi:TrmH family RNA methyltransferase